MYQNETKDKAQGNDTIKAKPNNTGIPDRIKSKFEDLSDLSFDDVRVHYNSEKPAQLQALAYTQGNQVYVAPGQERHLEHELGHVVQQKAGMVRPTSSVGGEPLNDDASLERMADSMATIRRIGTSVAGGESSVVQRVTNQAAIKYLMAQKLSEATATRLITSFVLPNDIIAISNTTKVQNAAISIRETGEYSLGHLAAGAGAKGHEILEKTIKASSLGVTVDTKSLKKKEIKAKEREAVKGMLEASSLPPEIAGLVASWSGTNITGLYLTSAGKAYFKQKEVTVKDAPKTFNIITEKKSDKETEKATDKLDLSSQEQKDAFNAFFKDKPDNWHSFFYTGDYDMHDMVSFISQAATIPSDSHEEARLISALNKEMGSTDEGEEAEQYKRIRHGPQVNYIAHNMDKEPEEKIVASVAALSTPLAMCTKGTWSLIKNADGLRHWYEKNVLNIKHTWASGGARQLSDMVNYLDRYSTMISNFEGVSSKSSKDLREQFLKACNDAHSALGNWEIAKVRTYPAAVKESLTDLLLTDYSKSADKLAARSAFFTAIYDIWKNYRTDEKTETASKPPAPETKTEKAM